MKTKEIIGAVLGAAIAIWLFTGCAGEYAVAYDQPTATYYRYSTPYYTPYYNYPYYRSSNRVIIGNHRRYRHDERLERDLNSHRPYYRPDSPWNTR